MLYFSEQARQNFALLYNNKDTKGQGLYRGVVVTRRLALQKFKKSSRLQEEKRQSNTVDYLFINMYSFTKKYIMYSYTSNDYCLSYASDMIAASTCDLLCSSFLGNKHISYKRIVQLYFCRYICL